MNKPRLFVLLLLGSIVWPGAARAQQVVINELHYNPVGAADSEEFIELVNIGPGSVDISAWSFTNGVEFIFPAATMLADGAFVVVAKDPTALQAATGFSGAFQWVVGSLANGGETVELSDNTLSVVDSLRYDDAGAWPTTPDGTGPSLELINPDFPNDVPNVWSASVAANGTPGAVNSVFSANPIILSEFPLRRTAVQALPTVSITFATTVTGVAAGDLTVGGSPATSLTGSDAGPYEFSGFSAPAADSGSVAISLAAASIQDLDSDPFGGDSWTVFVGQLIINEIHYGPATAAQLEEFIEIYNAGSSTFDLTGWVIPDGVAFAFPAGTMLNANSYLVVARDPASLQAATGFSGALQWLSGSLNNGGERISMLDPNANIVDEVRYDNHFPWPTEPDQTGPSLELLNPEFDNDFANVWRPSVAAHGTPGAANSVLSGDPVVLTESPPRGSVVVDVTSVSVTFAEVVTGVVAGDLTVNASAATSVSGSGAGPYLFSGYAAVSGGVVDVVLGVGSIQDVGANPFAGDSWSYLLNLPNIVINELHYHPDESIYPTEAIEFLELINAEATTVDISGWRISDGVQLTFAGGTTIPAGGFLVVALDPASLQAATGFATAIPWTSGRLSNAGERVRISDQFNNVVDEVTYSDAGEWPTAADGDGPSAELINTNLPNDFGPAWKSSVGNNGTPGAANSVFESNPAPLITRTKHTPPIPSAMADVTVTTTVIDDVLVNPAVTLFYRVDQSPTASYSSTTMFDDGAHGDALSGDNVYGATLSGLSDGSRLDFYIEASDGVGTGTVPPGHTVLDALGNPSQTFLCKFSNTAPVGDYPTYHITITEENRIDQEVSPRSKTEYDTTFIDNAGNIFYNTTERYRGQSSLNQNPPSYRVNFNANEPVQSEMGFETTALNFHAQQVARQMLGYELFEAAGMVASKRQPVRIILNPTTRTDINDHIYLNVERPDSQFLKRFNRFPPGLDDGNLYRGRIDADLRWEGFNPDTYRVNINNRNGYQKINHETEDEWTDLITLCDALTCDSGDGGLLCTEDNYDGVYASGLLPLIDIDEWAKWFAMHMVLNNQEGGIYLDTGDDYFLYMYPTPGDYRGTMIVTDMDSVFPFLATDRCVTDPQVCSIWRVGEKPDGTLTVDAVRRFIRHNTVAPIFVKAVRDILDTVFDTAVMNTRINAFDPQIANSGLRTFFKNWVADRHIFINAEIISTLTLNGVPASPYTNPDPLVVLSGTLNQAGTHSVTVNNQLAEIDVFNGTWSHGFVLSPGVNNIVVRGLDRNGVEMSQVADSVSYEPPFSGMRVTMPTRMINDNTLTLKAELLDASGNIDWRSWSLFGTVEVRRLSDDSLVPTSIVIFDEHDGVPAPDSIRFYNGIGSVSITLDNGAAEPPGNVVVTVMVGSASASRVVNILSGPTLRVLSGTLSAADTHWTPADGVIHIVDRITVNSGRTLQIDPGTLIMIDPGTPSDGTRITVSGKVRSLGTWDNPIYFFSSAGAAAMHLTVDCINEENWNPNAWHMIEHFNGQTSIYEHTFITGGGNGPIRGHTRAPILWAASTHSLEITDSMIVDNPGKCVYGSGSGTYTLTRSLFSRSGHGAEFTGVGDYTLTIEDCWFTSVGQGPQSCDRDGDFLNIRADDPSIGGPRIIRRSIFTDGNDDGIDQSKTFFTVEDCIIYDVRDKALSMELSGGVTMSNCLIFDTRRFGIRGGGTSVDLSHVTIASPAPVNGPRSGSTVVNSILWPNSLDTCGNASVDYTLIGNPGDLGCGTGNFSDDPLFNNSAGCDYTLAPASPARTAGPTGGRIGWLGFPSGEICAIAADCDDSDACTVDACIDGLCEHTTVVDCIPCVNSIDCDDNNFCTIDVCEGDNTCSFATANEGVACDDNIACTGDGTCGSGVCSTGLDDCPLGEVCNLFTELCEVLPETVTFQEGVSSYAGTHDTFLSENSPDSVFGALDNFEWDGDDPVGTALLNVGALRFTDMFGPGADQIPAGANIASATLTLVVFDPSTPPGADLHESLVTWDEDTATWNNFGGDAGVAVDERGPSVGVMPVFSGTANVDVTASLQAWATNPSLNLGWVMLPNSANGAQVRSSESVTVGDRPKLTVNFFLPACTVPADCTDGDVCTTDDCVGGSCTNDPIAGCCVDAADCDDSNVCTDDLCVGNVCQNNSNTDSCNDGDFCTTADVCAAGTCGGTAVDCSGFDDSCNDGVCNPASGSCETQSANEGGSCNDAIGCTSTDQCSGGICIGTDDCLTGDFCNHLTGSCENVSVLPISVGDNWRYFKGTQEPPASWDTIGLDSSSWLTGPTGIGYGDSDDATDLTDMQGNYISVYARKLFTVANPLNVSSLTLTIDYDDGVRAYINGVQVLDRFVPDPAAFDTTANPPGGNHEASGGNVDQSPNAPEVIDLSAFIGDLVSGVNVLAFQIHNATVGSSDLSFIPTLASTEAPSALPPIAEGVGSRYLAITPPDAASVAIQIDNAGFGCLPKYVDADGFLVAAPVFQSSAVWGTVFVGDADIVPSTQYEVRADVRTAIDPENLSDPALATTWMWGDTNDVNGVDIFDIVCVLDGFGDSFPNCTLQADDLRGDAPNRLVDLFDINAVLDAFQDLPYPGNAPCTVAALRGVSVPSARAVVTVIPRRKVIQAGWAVTVDVFATGIPDLRAYELALKVEGGARSTISVETMELDSSRDDYVFNGATGFFTSNMQRQRMVSAALEGGVDASDSVYLGTFILRASGGARGIFEVSADLAGGSIFLDSFGQQLDIRLTEPGIVVVEPPKRGRLIRPSGR